MLGPLYAHREAYIILFESQDATSVGENQLSRGFLQEILLDLLSPPSSSHQRLASRKPPSEAACQVCLNLHSWVILPSKASLRQDVFRVKIFIVNAIGEQSSHACQYIQRNALPASAAAALVSEVSPTWLSHGPSRNS